MGHAGGAKHIPIGPLDGPLVADHQRGQQARLSPIRYRGKDLLAHLLA